MRRALISTEVFVTRWRPLMLTLVASIALVAAFGGTSLSEIDDTGRAVGIRECTPEVLSNQNPGIAGKSDRLICFEAYVSNFDTEAHEDRDGKVMLYGVPHWVIQHVSRAKTAPESHDRPREWFTVPELQEQGLAPTDASYHFSQTFRQNHSNWYERGHLAQKYLAERLGHDAALFTHNVANAIPQRGRFNREPWQTLECYTGAWANRYGEVWIVSGPIFSLGHPSAWLKSNTNRKPFLVAIPDELFKVVVRKSTQNAWEALAFIYPQDDPSYYKRPYDPGSWLTSISQVEKLSGQELFPGSASGAPPPKDLIAPRLWDVGKKDFDLGCNQFARDVP